MASLRIPRLTIAVTNTSTMDGTESTATCKVVSGVLYDIAEWQMLQGGGSFSLDCQLESHDAVRLGLLFNYPRQIVRAASSVGTPLMTGVTFTATVPLRTLNEDRLGRDEIEAVVALSDSSGNFIMQARSPFVRIRA